MSPQFVLRHKEEGILPLVSYGSLAESIGLCHIYHSQKDNKQTISLTHDSQETYEKARVLGQTV